MQIYHSRLLLNMRELQFTYMFSSKQTYLSIFLLWNDVENAVKHMCSYYADIGFYIGYMLTIHFYVDNVLIITGYLCPYVFVYMVKILQRFLT
jgi:hypothetical protein